MVKDLNRDEPAKDPGTNQAGALPTEVLADAWHIRIDLSDGRRPDPDEIPEGMEGVYYL